MELVCIVALTLLGLFLIVKGGDMFVSAAAYIAEAAGVPQFVVGATVVSLATALPELMVSIVAAAGGQTEIAVGNAVGSPIANIGLIGAVAYIFMPYPFNKSNFFTSSLLALGSALALAVFGIFFKINLICSAVLLGFFAAFMWHSLKGAFKNTIVKGRGAAPVLPRVGRFIFGAAAIALGARMLVKGGQGLALNVFGVSPRVVAVTVIAVGTSLPELATTLCALCKKQYSLSIGNLLGANIIDVALILPLCRLVAKGEIKLSAATRHTDLPFLVVLTALCVLPPLKNKKSGPLTGAVLLILYIIYIIFSCG